MWYLLLFLQLAFWVNTARAGTCSSSTTPLSASCTCPSGGTMILQMSDSYGDGWNGNSITITTGGQSVTKTLSSGSSGSASITAGPTASISTYDGGGWSYEVSWVLKGCDGSEISSGTASSCDPCNIGDTTCGTSQTCTSGTCPAGNIFLDGVCYPGNTVFTQELTGYTYVRVGYCDPWEYLTVGKYPDHLSSSHPLYDSDRIMECAKRCNAQSNAGSPGFFLRTTDWKCACTNTANPDCSRVVGASGYATYKMTFTSVPVPVPCNPGYGGSPCTACIAGKFSPDGSGCESCPNGFYQSGTGQPSCEECPSNSASTSDKTVCQCNNGLELDGSVCKECIPGKTSWGGYPCDTCPEGYYMDESGGEDCKYCLPGQYQNQESQSSCKSCPSGQYQEYEGESSCDDCGTNEESNADKTGCQCAAGYAVERTIVENPDHQYCNDDRRTIHLETIYTQDESLTSKEAVIEKCHNACYDYAGFTTSLSGGSVTADSCTCRQYTPANCPGAVTTWGPPSLPGMAYDSSGGYVFKLEHVDVCVSNSCTDSTNVLTEDCPYTKNVIAPMEMVMYGWQSGNYGCNSKYNDWAWNGGWAIEFEGTQFIHNSYSWSTTQDFPLVLSGRITEISITAGHTWSGRTSCARWTLRCKGDTSNIRASGCDGSRCGEYPTSQIPGTVTTGPWDFTNNCPGGGDQIFTCLAGGLFYNGECTEPCDAGYYMDNECKVCPRGFYQNEAAKSACKECSGGFYQEGYGQTECKSCSPGQFSLDGSFEGCESCVEGQYQDQGAQDHCEECPNGSFSTDNKTECVEGCPPGQYDLDLGSCVDCPAGKFSIDQACQDCGDGTYQDETGQLACKLGCDSGKYLVQTSTASGLSLVTEEQIGSPFFCKYFGFHTAVPDSIQQHWMRDLSIYTSSVRNSMAAGLANGNGVIPASGIGSQNNIDGWGGTNCATHPEYCTCYAKCKGVGNVKYIAAEDKGNVNWVWTTGCYCMTGDRHSECLQGDATTDNVNVYEIEATVVNSCSICPTGYSKSSAGSDSCTLCEPGKYQDEVGQASCEYCMAGKSANSDGTGCLNCPVGYSKSSGEGSCTLCESGKYQDEVGQASCESCMAGKSANSDGTGCDCPEGQISDALDSECYDCLPGRFYVDYSCQECPAGYSKSSDDDSCILCGEYEFQDDVGQPSCKNCNVGFISSLYRTQCTYCPAEDTNYNDNWVTGCGPWATVDGCSCDCGDSGFTGEHCDVCGKGMGWNATSQKCLPCIYPYVNDQTSHDAVCSQDYCPPGQGTTQDKNAWSADNTTENCVGCTGSTVSPEYYGQCVSVVCNGRLVPKSSIDHTLEATNVNNCMGCEEGKVEHQQTCVDPVCVNGKPKLVIDQSLEYDSPANCLFCDTNAYMFMDSCIVESSCGPGTGLPVPDKIQYDLNHVRFLGNLVIGVEGSHTLVVYNEDTRIDIVLDDHIIDVEIFDGKIAIIRSTSDSSSVAFYDVGVNPFTLHASMQSGQPMEIACTDPCKDIEVDTNLYVGYSQKVEEYNSGLGKVNEREMRGSSISVGNNVIAGSDDDRLNIYAPECPSCATWLGSGTGYMNSVRKDGAYVAWAYDYDDRTLLRTYNLGTRQELYIVVARIDVMYWFGNNLLVGGVHGLIMYDENLYIVKTMTNDPVFSISGFIEESGVSGDWRSIENIVTNGLSSGSPSITRYRFACETCESPFVNDGSSLRCAKIVCSDTSYSYKVSGVDVSLAYDNDANCEPCSGIQSGDPCQPIECDTGSILKSYVGMEMDHTLPHDDQNNCFQCAETQVVRLNSCVDIQCNDGQKINRVGDYEPNDQRNCENCTGFEVGNGYTCIPIDCGTHTRKNSIDHTLTYNDMRNCGGQCEGGTILNVANKTQCVECTGNTVPNVDHTECIDVECNIGYEASITDRSLPYNDQRNCVEKNECANDPCTGKCTDLLNTYVCDDDIIMGHGIADFAHKNTHICPHGFVLSSYKSSIVSEVTDSRGNFNCPNFISYGETVVFKSEIFNITGDPLITEANFENNICEYRYHKIARNMETFVIGTHNAQADDGSVYIYCPHRCPHIKCGTDEICVRGFCEKHTCTTNSKDVLGCDCFGITCSDWCMDNGKCVDVLVNPDIDELKTAFG